MVTNTFIFVDTHTIRSVSNYELFQSNNPYWTIFFQSTHKICKGGAEKSGSTSWPKNDGEVNPTYIFLLLFEFISNWYDTKWKMSLIDMAQNHWYIGSWCIIILKKYYNQINSSNIKLCFSLNHLIHGEKQKNSE